jgi:hypothetical protein
MSSVDKDYVESGAARGRRHVAVPSATGSDISVVHAARLSGRE